MDHLPCPPPKFRTTALNIKDQATEIRSHSSSTHSVLAKRKLLLYAHILSFIADWTTVVLQIGINYIYQEGQLEGCINDAENIKAFLTGKSQQRRPA